MKMERIINVTQSEVNVLLNFLQFYDDNYEEFDGICLNAADILEELKLTVTNPQRAKEKNYYTFNIIAD